MVELWRKNNNFICDYKVMCEIVFLVVCRKNKAQHILMYWATNNSWQRPTLPHSHPCSTIGAEGLNCRVRNGNGCFPFAIVTRKTLPRV